VELQVGVDQSVEQGAMLGAQRALFGEQLGEGLTRRGRPDGEGHDELVAGDHPVLECQQA
jgi:hypothetical protein